MGGDYFFPYSGSHKYLAYGLSGVIPEYEHVDTVALKKTKALAGKSVESFIADVRRNHSDNLIISAEQFWMPISEQQALALKSFFYTLADEVYIIVYVRRHADLMESKFNQRVRGGRRMPLFSRWAHDTMNEHSYEGILTSYIKAFGKQNVDVRILDPKFLIGGDVVSDFSSVIGLKCGHDALVRGSRVNQSLPNVAVEIIRQVIYPIPEWSERKLVARFLARNLSIDGGKNFALSGASVVESIDDYFSAEEAWIFNIASNVSSRDLRFFRKERLPMHKKIAEDVISDLRKKARAAVIKN